MKRFCSVLFLMMAALSPLTGEERFVENEDLSGQHKVVNARHAWHVTDAGLKRLRSYVLRGEIDIYMQNKVQRLMLDGTRVTDAGMKHLEGKDGLGGLEELSLADTQITDAGLASLRGLRSLRRLNLGQTFVVKGGASGPQVTAAGIEMLRTALPACRIEHQRIPLELSAAQQRRFQLWSQVAAARLNRRGDIVALSLRNEAKLTPDHHKGLSELAHLEELFAAGRFSSEEDVALLARSKSMRYLCLRGCPLDKKTVQILAKITDLRVLDVADIQLTDRDLESLRSLRSLEALDLRATRATTSGLQKLRQALPTTKFVFDPWRVVGLPYRNLKVNDQFELVDVGTIGYRVSCVELARQLTELLKHSTLERLSLRHSELTDEELKIVARMSNLKELDIGNTKITSVGVNQLAHLKLLEKLNLWHTKITADGGLSALKDLKKLRSLELDETSINDTALKSLAELTGLRYTELWHTDATLAGVAKLQKQRPNLEIKANPRR